MIRVTTGGSYSAVLANIMAAQQRQIDAGAQVATQKMGTNLKDYARNAEILTGLRSIDTRLTGYVDQNKTVADKLTTQDLALNQVADSAGQVRQLLSDAIASGRADTLMQELRSQFVNSVSGLNSRYAGKYLFAGGQIDTQPVSATTLTDLTNPAYAISDFFHNDDFVTQAKVDDSTTVDTGLLADNLGTGLLDAFKTLQAFEESGSGPFTASLTTAQADFLKSQLSVWDQVHSDLINHTARNGMIQTRVDGVNKDLDSRQTTIRSMVGGVTDADMAEAASNLAQAQLAVQAAAQVFTSLQNSSLLNVLR